MYLFNSYNMHLTKWIIYWTFTEANLGKVLLQTVRYVVTAAELRHGFIYWNEFVQMLKIIWMVNTYTYNLMFTINSNKIRDERSLMKKRKWCQNWILILINITSIETIVITEHLFFCSRLPYPHSLHGACNTLYAWIQKSIKIHASWIENEMENDAHERKSEMKKRQILCVPMLTHNTVEQIQLENISNDFNRIKRKKMFRLNAFPVPRFFFA